MAPPTVTETTLLLIVLAIVFLLAVLALVVSSVIVVIKLVRALFAAPTPALDELPVAAPSSTASVAVGATTPRSHAAGPSGSPQDPADEGLARLAVWRYWELVRSGLDPVSAIEASLRGVDVGGVRSLVERGCEPALAVAILLPDDDGGRRARSRNDASAKRPARPSSRSRPAG